MQRHPGKYHMRGIGVCALRYTLRMTARPSTVSLMGVVVLVYAVLCVYACDKGRVPKRNVS